MAMTETVLAVNFLAIPRISDCNVLLTSEKSGRHRGAIWKMGGFIMTESTRSAWGRTARLAGSAGVLTAGLIAGSALGVGAPTASAFNACVSLGKLDLHTGSATCKSTGPSLAIAVGYDSTATSGGTLGFAWALGADSTATAQDGTLNAALALGKYSTAYAYDNSMPGTAGNLNAALALGYDSEAYAYEGNANLATALGKTAEARPTKAISTWPPPSAAAMRPTPRPTTARSTGPLLSAADTKSVPRPTTGNNNSALNLFGRGYYRDCLSLRRQQQSGAQCHDGRLRAAYS